MLRSLSGLPRRFRLCSGPLLATSLYELVVTASRGHLKLLAPFESYLTSLWPDLPQPVLPLVTIVALVLALATVPS